MLRETPKYDAWLSSQDFNNLDLSLTLALSMPFDALHELILYWRESPSGYPSWMERCNIAYKIRRSKLGGLLYA